ncbi:MAG TPA: helix-turn-helix domain-containing protein [Egibacteraceae bacterium]|jgi:DNA-binding HxlR family transcriptional regulator|nr:helix-turn-helix domain-containing protein [Egibacteraceae bacterium]
MTTASPLSAALARVGDRWSLLIVDALLDGPRRFNELQEAVEGIAPNILSRRLSDLERQGVLSTTPYTTRPLRVTYELTAAGEELASALRLLAQWGSAYAGEASAIRHEACGTPVQARWHCPTCGRTLEDGEASDLSYV